MIFKTKEEPGKKRSEGKKLQHMGNCFTSPVKSLTPSTSTRPSSPGTRTSSVTTTTGKLSTNRGSTCGQSTDSSSENNSSEVCGQILETPNLRVFTFAELKSATKNFHPDTVLGEGGFGRVYKGWVDGKTLNPTKNGLGMVIAVKKLNHESVQGLEQWQSEVNFLGRISHPNLVKLLGYCWEDKELLLVYEFMARGCLENHFFRRGGGGGMQPLSWSLRLKIVLGAARGLAFLHSSEKQVIYRDFKASNILLDSNYNAKLSDFGLAKHGPTGGDSHVTTRVMGTYGYAAPEYVATGHLYVKSDVYGFGVVLLEMLSGQRAFDLKRPREKQNLVNWAKPFLSDRKKFSRIMDPQLDGDYALKGALLAAQLTLKCLAGNPRDRPSMNEVVETLENVEAMSKPKESEDKSQLVLGRSRGKGRAHGSPVHPRHDANGPAARPDHQKLRIR